MQSSPFENILHTNAVPSDADCQRIRDFIAGPLKEAADLTTEIARMQNLIDELTQKRDALTDSIAAHLAMVSPARRLPEDIVRDVFVACLPAHRNPFILSNESPLLLCQICSGWRELALSTPRLWAAVHVVVPNERKVQVLAEMLTQWLNRSGILPLSISVVFSLSWKDDRHAITHPLLTQLLDFSRRWQHLRFNFPHPKHFSAFETLCPDDAPMLKSMGVRGIERRRWLDLEHPFASFKALSFLDNSSLRSVTITYDPDLRKMPLPWEHLSNLSVKGSMTCAEAVEILRGGPALETCDLSLVQSSDDTPAHRESIPLLQLRHLTVTGATQDESDLAAFFSLLVLPDLRYLEYSHNCPIAADPLPIAPVLAATPALEQLTLILMELPNSGPLVGCLVAVPLLQHLKLDIRPPPPWQLNDQPQEAIIAQLTPRLDGPDVLCPRLHTLDMSGLNDTVSDEALLQLVQGRTGTRPQGVARLSRLSCSIEREVQVDILPLLQEEICAGLVVSIEHRPPFTHKYSPAESAEDTFQPYCSLRLGGIRSRISPNGLKFHSRSTCVLNGLATRLTSSAQNWMRQQRQRRTAFGSRPEFRLTPKHCHPCELDAFAVYAPPPPPLTNKLLARSSPFETILHTNVVPSDADCQRIRDFIAGPQRECAELTDEISRMQQLLNELTQKRDALDDFIAAHLTMVSPARRLPEDIIRDVFMACLPSHRNPFIISNDSPLLLCQICRDWRRLALSTPRLWAAVHVVVPDEPKAQVLAGLLKDWLSRSGVLPLSISVVFSRVCTREDDAVATLGLLTSFSRRWGNIQFEFPNHGYFAAFANLCPDDVPMLQRIVVHGLGRSFSWGQLDDLVDSYKFLTFLDTPSLRRVSIGYIPELYKLPLPWANLSELVVDNELIPCDAAIAILRQCPALEICALSIDPWIPTTNVQESIFLPHLRFLTISGELQSTAGSLFTVLDVPNLRSLTYSQQSWLGYTLPFSPLLAGSLEHFSLTVMELPGDVHMLSECLAAMPLLQDLELVITARSRETLNHEYVVEQLTPSRNGPASVLCPVLQSLVLIGLNETVSDDALLQLVRGRTSSRPQGVARLSQLNIIAARDKQTDILPLLQEEISFGLVISLEYQPPYQDVYSPAEGPGGMLLW
ncbi:hypothetical protein DFH09DRAFT_1286319 [Mycena vulgaris]|nr:hypothetical protein DFH09DRAFT_1286319 [Mycena vulgaris]